MTERRERLVWLDLEMTGLDPRKDTILQLGVAITEPGSFDVLESFEVDIWQPESRLEVMSPFVRKMHESSGLLERVRRSPTSEEEAERAALDVVARWCGPRQGVLAGNSIWQDRRFLAAYMPVLEGYLHFRMVDVTSLKIIAKAWLGDRAVFKKEKAHTAMEDVKASLAELAHYKKMFGVEKG
jgi:oligoribonuclease